MLQAATQYRETKAFMYRASESAAAEPEYVPWTGASFRLHPRHVQLLLVYLGLKANESACKISSMCGLFVTQLNFLCFWSPEMFENPFL